MCGVGRVGTVSNHKKWNNILYRIFFCNKFASKYTVPRPVCFFFTPFFLLRSTGLLTTFVVQKKAATANPKVGGKYMIEKRERSKKRKKKTNRILT